MASAVFGALLAGLACSAHAGVVLPLVLMYGTPQNSTLTSPGLSQAGPTQTITVNLNQNGNPSYGASLLSLALAGTDAADFEIVPGGTCVAGTTLLYPAGATCTVKVNYTASTTSNESALLTASCQSVIGVSGGYTILCNSAVGTVAELLGELAVVATAVPALSPAMLTGLAATLFALASFAALRRRPAPRRRT